MKTELLALIENYGKALVYQTEGKISAFKDAKNLMSNIVFMLDKAEQAPVAKCEACNDNGLIGGPSFYDPGEGGVPCPDCSAPAAVEPVEIDYPHEQMDALALARYKVIPSDQSMYWRHAVVAGEGLQHLYNGSEFDCQIMARKFAGAFLDGAFTFHQRYTVPLAQPSDALDAETIQKAKRYDWLRHGDNDEKVIMRGPVAHDFVYLPRNEKLDALIDAAMATQGAKP